MASLPQTAQAVELILPAGAEDDEPLARATARLLSNV
jgi:hypothetical protein